MDQNPNSKMSQKQRNNITNMESNQQLDSVVNTVKGPKLTNEDPPKVRQYVDCDEGWC